MTTMARWLSVLVLVLLVGTPLLPMAQPGGSATAMDGPSPQVDAGTPWWETWPGDADGNGVHDALEERVALDPDGRVDVVVDMDRDPTGLDVERLELLGMGVQHVSHHVDAVLGSLPSRNVRVARSLPGVVMLESQGAGVPLLESASRAVNLPKVHNEFGFDGSGVTVAVLDTGVNADHVALDDIDDDPLSDDPKLVVFYDAYSNSTTDPYDGGEHGTWVSGIAVGTGGPSSNNVGGAPGARLVGVRIGVEGGFPEWTSLRGMEWVIDHRETYNISVMVCSWGILLGGPNDHNGNSAISRAADRAVAAGINVVVAAGNSALSATVTAPGDAFNVVTVGSVSDDHILSSFSSEGPTTDGRIKPDVCAPGEDVTGPWSRSNTGFYTGDGTSASAPLVGGLIACMLEANPDLTPAQVKQILHETSEHNTARAAKYFFTPNNGYGWGMVHSPGAVMRAKDMRSPSLDVPVNLGSGEALDLEVSGAYTRTIFTEYGEDGTDRLGEDSIVLEATVPDDWDRPSRVTYTMEGDIIATVIPEPVSQSGGSWQLRATFRMRTDVDSITTAHPTIRFSTAAPLRSDPETYVLTTRESLNAMAGPLGRYRVSVGGNVVPDIQLLNPDGGPDMADTFYVIRWTDDDPDDNARISLFNDVDTDPSSDRVLITSGLREDPEGDGDSYLWDTSTLVSGRSYYIQAVIDDGVNEPVSVYSTGAVTISHTGGNVPPSVEVMEPDGQGDTADESFTIQYGAWDPDDVATVSLYWDTDDGGFDGSAIARDLEEADGVATYVWDTSALADGTYHVYAVATDGRNPQARAYGEGPVTVRHETGPQVIDHSPSGEDVDLDQPVTVTFDRPMDQTSVMSATSVTPQTPGDFRWEGPTMEFSPTGGWAPRTWHTVVISTSAMDTEGNPLAEEHRWTFRTADAGQDRPPRATITDPAEGATVSGLVWISGTATDVAAGGRVEVRIDGGDWRNASGVGAWSISWDTTAGLDGGHTISARGVDPTERVGPLDTVNVTVRNTPGSPPQVTEVQDSRASTGEEKTIQVVATDPDGDDLTYSDDTPLFDIDADTGLIRFTPTDAQVGEWTVTITVSDGVHQTKTTFLITVEPKEGDVGGLLGRLGLTPLQFALLLVVVVAVAGIAAAARRASRRGEEEDDEEAMAPSPRRTDG